MDKLFNHKDRGHALLSASGAERWLNCTPSPRLEEAFGVKRDSVYANEGTLAHELAELFLHKDMLSDIDDDTFSAKLKDIESNPLYTDDMPSNITIYTSYCKDTYIAATQTGSPYYASIETYLDFSDFVPEGFGTADCIIVSGNTIEVIDLKYGRGIPVYADNNKQLMLYGLGAYGIYSLIGDITEVCLTIVQPRLNNISSWRINVNDLLEWGYSVVKPKALEAYDGLGETKPGEWCRFCAFRHRCQALADDNLTLAKYDFKNKTELSDDDIAEIVKRAPRFTEWLNDICAYAVSEAENSGKKWPGLRLIDGPSSRRWTVVEDEIGRRIVEYDPGLSYDDITDVKLKPITALEKILGKKALNTVLGDVIETVHGKCRLVAEDDTFNLRQAKSEFSD